MGSLAEIAGAGVRARRAAPADAPALQALMDAARDYFERTEGEPAGPDAARALLEDAEADEQRAVYLVSPPRAAPSGFLDLHLHQPEPGVAHVGVLALRPEARGRGLGGALVEALVTTLRDEGFTAVRASVGDENPEARAFWDRAGFAEVGRLEGGVTVLERGLL